MSEPSASFIEAIDAEIAELQREYALLERRLAELKQFRERYIKSNPNTQPIRQSVVEIARELIKANHGWPVPRSFVYKAALERGVVFGGKDPLTHISIILGRDPAFVTKKHKGWMLAD